MCRPIQSPSSHSVRATRGITLMFLVPSLGSRSGLPRCSRQTRLAMIGKQTSPTCFAMGHPRPGSAGLHNTSVTSSNFYVCFWFLSFGRSPGRLQEAVFFPKSMVQGHLRPGHGGLFCVCVLLISVLEQLGPTVVARSAGVSARIGSCLAQWHSC